MAKNKGANATTIAPETITEINSIISTSGDRFITPPNFTMESAEALAITSSQILDGKAKVSHSYKDIPSLTEDLGAQIKRLGITSFYEWYMDQGHHIDFEIDRTLKPNEGYISQEGILLPNNLTTEQQITLGSLLARKMLDSNRRIQDSYELQETVPLLLNYLMHSAQNGGSKVGAVQGIIVSTRQIGKEYNSLFDDTKKKIAKFHSLTSAQTEDMATGFVATQERFSSMEAALHMIGVEEDFRRGLGATMSGEQTVSGFLNDYGFQKETNTSLPAAIKQYVISKPTPYQH